MLLWLTGRDFDATTLLYKYLTAFLRGINIKEICSFSTRDLIDDCMEDLNYIKKQLRGFIRKYYLNELLKGSILFFSIWLLYFILVLLIEYFFWLTPPYRSMLFWFCILVSAGLFFRFVIIPVAKLLRLKGGIDEFDASRIIGKHFPEVGDKLVNVLQLQNSQHKSELLLAGISQKSKQLRPVPFKMAVNFKSSLKYLKYAAFPVIIIIAVILTGNTSVFSDSYTRMIHYKTAYEPPAPFAFQVKNEVLIVEEGSSITLNVETIGNIKPETASIHFNDEMYYLKTGARGGFHYTFQGVKQDIEFYLSANGVNSRKYKILVVKVPKLLDFEMELEYPKYLGIPAETIKGTGNATFPEGTKVSWNLRTRSTEEVVYQAQDTIQTFLQMGDNYNLSMKFFNNTTYEIKTSNSQVRDYETMTYKATVIKDQFPEIKVEQGKDTMSGEELYFYGKISDDHAISSLNIVYFIDNEESNATRVSILVNRGVFAEFFYAFPGNLDLENGADYSFYFEVFDNDGIRGPKRSKTGNFGFRKKSDDEVKEDQLQKQGESIQNLSQSLEKMELTERELEELSRLQREKDQLNFNDRKKLEDFLERQKQQNQIIKNYSEKLKQTLEQPNSRENDPFKDELKERLERNEDRLEQNEELLEELQKYSDKISREELAEKLEQLSRQNSNEQKNLEQLLELTKRYYVQEKTQKLASDLLKLAEKQERLPDDEKQNTGENQEKLNEEFQEFQKQMDDLEKENSGLKKPIELGRDEEKESEIQQDQENASNELEKENKEDAEKKQKDAAKKMKEMSMKMQKTQNMSQGEQLDANIESLRQILDNLMVFSFNQEDLLIKFRDIRANNPGYAKELKKQQVLKEHFQHIDDSLFALALNNPMITEKITSKLTDIEFDINKSLDRLAQNEIPQGTASQQYVMTGTNDLALMLSEVLNNMQEMANPSAGNGEGRDIQLPDLIVNQEELAKKMEEGLEKGEQGSLKENGNNGEEKGEDEQGGKEGSNGEEMKGDLFEIYKQQLMLKQQLENKLREMGLFETNSPLLREMEQVEREILDEGFNQKTLEKMNRITHRLLELESATREQEEEQERRARTNLEEFDNNAQDQILKAKEYFRSTEILNRQSLPLRQIYKAKVKEYFGATDN